MAFTPSATAIAMATAAGDNMFALDPKYTALKDSIAGGNLAPAAYIDGIAVTTVPVILHDDGNMGAGTSPLAMTNVGAAWSPTVPYARTYVLDTHVQCRYNLATGSDAVFFQVRVDGVVQVQGPKLIHSSSVLQNIVQTLHMPIVLALTAGAHTFQVQWQSGVVNAFIVDASLSRHFVLRG